MTSLTIRNVTAADRGAYLLLAKEFYASGAALFSVPDENLARTFDEVMRSNAYAEALLIECDGQKAGFALLAKTFSQEAGGMVLWLEELYVRPAFRGLGLGSKVFSFLRERYGGTFARIRLEIETENENARRLYYRWGFEDYPYEQMRLELLQEAK